MVEPAREVKQRVLTRPTDDKIRVIDENGEQIGIIDVRTALEIANERDLDLVEVNPNVDPPTCRLLNFGKWKYNQRKRQKGSKKTVNKRKEVKLRPKVEDHDFEVKVKRAKKFLEEGHKVLVTLTFKGREQRHPEIGFTLLERFAASLEEIARVEKTPSREGNNRLGMILAKK